MGAKIRSFFSSLASLLGIDWLVLLVLRKSPVDASSCEPTNLKMIRLKIRNLTDSQRLDDALEFCSDSLDHEEARIDRIESKAVTMIGITALCGVLIVGFTTLLLGQAKTGADWTRTIVAVLFMLTVIYLLGSIYLALRVVAIGKYKFARPAVNDIFTAADGSLAATKRERLASLIYSLEQNSEVGNAKGTLLGGSQLMFRNSIFLLLCLLVFVVLAFLVT